MLICEVYDHRGGAVLCESNAAFVELYGQIKNMDARFERGSAATVKGAAREICEELGWATNVKVCPPFKPDINAFRGGIGLTMQTGNIARAFYDLLKLESMFLADRIYAASLLLPSGTAAKRLGQNIANFDRVKAELSEVYRHVITVPCMLISIGE